jgi:hypothetical protein
MEQEMIDGINAALVTYNKTTGLDSNKSTTYKLGFAIASMVIADNLLDALHDAGFPFDDLCDTVNSVRTVVEANTMVGAAPATEFDKVSK